MEAVKNSVLIVDDEAINITTLSYMLSPEYMIYAEKDGKGCIETAKTLQPDVILLDVVMPNMNGFEVITALKKNETTCDIPVIFITSLGEVQDEEMGLVLGAVDYISRPFSKAIVELRVKNQMKILNQMRTINNLSVTDTLTGIGNRRYFNTMLAQEWKRAIRQRSHIGFLMIDIDHFKGYNDDYGHMEGDRILKGIARVIKRELNRATDKLARWGGEEFAVILPDTMKAGALKVAEEIRFSVENEDFERSDGTFANITVSIGVHTVTPERNGTYSLDNFISDADDALYHAKRSGRNQVCLATEIGG